jgi:hypothetical protein
MPQPLIPIEQINNVPIVDTTWGGIQPVLEYHYIQ